MNIEAMIDWLSDEYTSAELVEKLDIPPDALLDYMLQYIIEDDDRRELFKNLIEEEGMEAIDSNV